jgi:hypothetical protein
MSKLSPLAYKARFTSGNGPIEQLLFTLTTVSAK